jgi:Ser-tRNA(Ala) deacylase AlaX
MNIINPHEELRGLKMSQRGYYYSDELQQQALIVACNEWEEGLYSVELDTTLFHPQGGGQPADSGTIGDAEVLRVISQGEKVQHIVAQPLPTGVTNIQVSAAVRHLHTRWHSAGHLIGYLGETRGWQPVKAHHWPGEGRITFNVGADSQPLTAEFLQDELAKLIAADLPRIQSEQDGLRQVGFGELPAYGCGGTHVRSLAELGQVQITAAKMKKGQWVVQYVLD